MSVPKINGDGQHINYADEYGHIYGIPVSVTGSMHA